MWLFNYIHYDWFELCKQEALDIKLCQRVDLEKDFWSFNITAYS